MAQDITDLTRLAASPELPGSAAASGSGHGDAPRGTTRPDIGAGGGASPQIDDLLFIRQLGRGGFGEAWLAEDSARRRCVVKVLYPGASEIELEAYQSYKNLCDASADGLVPIGTMLRTRDGRYWYSMEPADDLNPQNQDLQRYEATTLEGLIRREGRLGGEQVLMVAEECLAALDRIHRKNLAHCDIKPGNLLRIGGRWRLGDTGTLLRESDLPSRACSPAYAPPEGIVELRDDLYCLGKTLYQSLTGRVDTYPAPTYFDQAADDEERNRLRVLNQVILRACSTDPRERYGSAEAMLRDVRAARQGREVRPRAPRRWLMLAAAALVLLVIGVPLLILPALGAGPIRVLAFEINHLRKEGERLRNYGLIGRDTQGALVGDDVTVSFELSRPAYCYLLALTPDGQVRCCLPEDASQAPQRVRQAAFPALSNGTNTWGLEEGAGLHAFLLLAARSRLPAFDDWIRSLGSLPWENAHSDIGWRFDGQQFLPLAVTRGLRTHDGPPEPFRRACIRIADLPDIDRVIAVAFPVTAPDDDAGGEAP